MDKLAVEEFKRDFIIKTFVQETQFEQWLKLFFFLNNELSEKYDFIYQDAFYTKFYELFTEGFVYANKVLDALQDGDNEDKRNWYIKLIDGLKNIKSELTDIEFEYIEYKRHNACHIFQNSYEHIQENLRIKKERNGKKLQDIKKGLQELILKHGSDKNIDYHINKKLQEKLKLLYKQLTEKKTPLT
ncbi:MAG TPA: hypothetical protein VHA74_00265 [Candidatus Dojkabacteria bacterium]|nr:hypothetical protein [Candidatus Dojkabacteria bacterium]